MLGMSMFLPFLPLYLRQLGVTDPGQLAFMSGLLFAAPFFAATVATPVWGVLGDRHGRKLMVVRASLGLALATLLMGFARTPSQLFLLRLAQGAVSGFIAAALALMASRAPNERMGYALGTLQTAIPTGTILGPLIGGTLADLIGYREIFFVTAGFNLFAAFLVVFLVPRDLPAPADAKTGRIVDNYRTVFGTRQFRILFFVLFGSQFALMSIQPVMALYVESLGASGRLLATTTGVIFAVTGVASAIAAPMWGRRGDRRGYRKVLGRALAGAAVFALPQGIVARAWQLLVLRIGYGAYVGGIVPAVQAMIGIRAPAERRAGIMGVTSTALMLGNLTGPLIGGAVAGSFGLRSVFFLATAVLVALLVSLYPRMAEPDREEPRSGSDARPGEPQHEEAEGAAAVKGLPSPC
jgi:DHA1 family multidrug resistance protein-like MFS transporter